MPGADLHLHTCYSHGVNTPAEMYRAACQKGLAIAGFSEHSPRPRGYDYSHEYRDKLARHLPDYLREVQELKRTAPPGACQVLLGMEIDWLGEEREFVQAAIGAHDFDYLLGSVHFLGRWGFDDGSRPWENASRAECEAHYASYFHAWKDMLASGLFNIAAHPDLIKIYSVARFHTWLARPESQDLVYSCLLVLREQGMAMEISSAGLRKPCREIYPAPQIMAMAADLGLSVSIASDAHNINDVAADFPRLVAYARSFGFEHQTVFDRGRELSLPFPD